MLNHNPTTAMNHLFNGVLINNEWRAVEPQAAFTHKASYWMRDVWEYAYDPSRNRDVTSEWRRYVR